MPPVQPDVCFVNEQGQLICGTSTGTTVDARTRAAVQSALGRVSDERLNLITALITEVLDAPIDDRCIANRTDDIVQSVHILLQPPSPVMLLYRYVPVPGNIMATWFIHQIDLHDNFAAARRALDDWADLKEGCEP